MEKFNSLLLGPNDPPTFFAAIFFVGFGAILRLRIKASKRNVSSLSTPIAFSWRFLLQDNFQQFITGFLIALLAIRFTSEFLGSNLTMWLAVVIGFSTTELAGRFESFELKARK